MNLPLTSEELRLIRARNLSRRGEFMEMANAVCELMAVKYADICSVRRGGPDVCEARALICRIAFDRGFHPTLIGRYIRRDRSTVIHAIKRTREKSVNKTDSEHPLLQLGGGNG